MCVFGYSMVFPRVIHIMRQIVLFLDRMAASILARVFFTARKSKRRTDRSEIVMGASGGSTHEPGKSSVLFPMISQIHMDTFLTAGDKILFTMVRARTLIMRPLSQDISITLRSAETNHQVHWSTTEKPVLAPQRKFNLPIIFPRRIKTTFSSAM